MCPSQSPGRATSLKGGFPLFPFLTAWGTGCGRFCSNWGYCTPSYRPQVLCAGRPKTPQFLSKLTVYSNVNSIAFCYALCSCFPLFLIWETLGCLKHNRLLSLWLLKPARQQDCFKLDKPLGPVRPSGLSQPKKLLSSLDSVQHMLQFEDFTAKDFKCLPNTSIPRVNLTGNLWYLGKHVTSLAFWFQLLQ